MAADGVEEPEDGRTAEWAAAWDARAQADALAEALGGVGCPNRRVADHGGCYDELGCTAYVTNAVAVTCHSCRTLAAYREKWGGCIND